MDAKKNITLADILKSVLTYWYIIVLSTLFFGACFFLYFKAAEPTFKTSSILFLDFEKKMSTRFGEYTPRNVSSRDYLSLLKDEKYIRETINEFDLDISVEDFEDKLNIVFPEYENSKSVTLEIVLTYERVDKVLSYHISTFIRNLKEYHQVEAVNYFKSEFQSNLELLSKEEKYLKKTLGIRDSILRDMSPSNFEASQISKLEKQGFNVSMHDFFSPEYKMLAEELVEIRNSLLEVQNEKDKLIDLRSDILNIEKKLESQEFNDNELFESQNYVSIFAESDKVVNVSKSILKYTVLGLFIGLVIALFVTLLIVINAKNKTVE